MGDVKQYMAIMLNMYRKKVCIMAGCGKKPKKKGKGGKKPKK